MALSFLASKPPRTNFASQNPISLKSPDGTTWTIEFHSGRPNADGTTSASSADTWYFTETVPPRIDGKPNLHTPPYHWHRVQDETFTVLKGAILFTIEGNSKTLIAGETLTVPRGTYHTFTNASVTEEMKVAISLNPTTRETEEAFFRNGHGLLHDYAAAGMEPSVWQIMLVCYSVDLMLVLPGPKFIAKPLSRLLVFFGGIVIGSWLLGYKASYPEYAHEKAK